MSTFVEARPIPAGTWQIDPVHSHVGFAVEYMSGTFRGTFSPVDARLSVAEDGEATLAGSARVDSVRVQDENLTAHLLSPEFFDAERAPEIRFASRRIRRSGDELEVDGALEAKGLSEEVELRGTIGEPVTDAYGRERIGLKLAGTLDRTRLGLDWNLQLPSGEPALASDVELTAELYLVKA